MVKANHALSNSAQYCKYTRLAEEQWYQAGSESIVWLSYTSTIKSVYVTVQKRFKIFHMEPEIPNNTL